MALQEAIIIWQLKMFYKFLRTSDVYLEAEASPRGSKSAASALLVLMPRLGLADMASVSSVFTLRYDYSQLSSIHLLYICV